MTRGTSKKRLSLFLALLMIFSTITGWAGPSLATQELEPGSLKTREEMTKAAIQEMMRLEASEEGETGEEEPVTSEGEALTATPTAPADMMLAPRTGFTATADSWMNKDKDLDANALFDLSLSKKWHTYYGGGPDEAKKEFPYNVYIDTKNTEPYSGLVLCMRVDQDASNHTGWPAQVNLYFGDSEEAVKSQTTPKYSVSIPENTYNAQKQAYIAFSEEESAQFIRMEVTSALGGADYTNIAELLFLKKAQTYPLNLMKNRAVAAYGFWPDVHIDEWGNTGAIAIPGLKADSVAEHDMSTLVKDDYRGDKGTLKTFTSALGIHPETNNQDGFVIVPGAKSLAGKYLEGWIGTNNDCTQNPNENGVIDWSIQVDGVKQKAFKNFDGSENSEVITLSHKKPAYFFSFQIPENANEIRVVSNTGEGNFEDHAVVGDLSIVDTPTEILDKEVTVDKEVPVTQEEETSAENAIGTVQVIPGEKGTEQHVRKYRVADGWVIDIANADVVNVTKEMTPTRTITGTKTADLVESIADGAAAASEEGNNTLLTWTANDNATRGYNVYEVSGESWTKLNDERLSQETTSFTVEGQDKTKQYVVVGYGGEENAETAMKSAVLQLSEETPQQFNVTFNIGTNGTVAEDQQALLNQTITEGTEWTAVQVPEVTAKENFRFAGWNPTIPTEGTVTENTTFNAQYVDLTELKAQIAIAEGMDLTAVTDESKESFKEALKTARDGLDAGNQEAVNGAKDALMTAMQRGLKYKSLDAFKTNDNVITEWVYFNKPDTHGETQIATSGTWLEGGAPGNHKWSNAAKSWVTFTSPGEVLGFELQTKLGSGANLASIRMNVNNKETIVGYNNMRSQTSGEYFNPAMTLVKDEKQNMTVKVFVEEPNVNVSGIRWLKEAPKAQVTFKKTGDLTFTEDPSAEQLDKTFEVGAQVTFPEITKEIEPGYLLVWKKDNKVVDIANEKAVDGAVYTVSYEKDPTKWVTLTFDAGEHGKYEGDQKTLGFEMLKGTTPASNQVEEPALTVDQGYRFTGYNYPSEDFLNQVLNENTTVTAQYEKTPVSQYTITFTLMGEIDHADILGNTTRKVAPNTAWSSITIPEVRVDDHYISSENWLDENNEVFSFEGTVDRDITLHKTITKDPADWITITLTTDGASSFKDVPKGSETTYEYKVLSGGEWNAELVPKYAPAPGYEEGYNFVWQPALPTEQNPTQDTTYRLEAVEDYTNPVWKLITLLPGDHGVLQQRNTEGGWEEVEKVQQHIYEGDVLEENLVLPKVVPENGWKFDKWVDENNLEVDMSAEVESPLTMKASYVKDPDAWVSLEQSITGEGRLEITPEADSDGQYLKGQTLVITPKAGENYELSSLKVGPVGGELVDVTASLNEDSYTFDIQANTRVEATFTKGAAALTFDQPTGGKLAVTVKDQPVNSGDSVAIGEEVKFTVTPDRGYAVKSVSVLKEGESEPTPLEAVDGVYSFTFEGASSIQVTMEQLPMHTVQFVTNGLGSFVSGATEVNLYQGESLEISQFPEYQANKGFKFAGWFVGNEQVESVTMGEEDITVMAKFVYDPDQWATVRFIADNGGELNGITYLKVLKGTNWEDVEKPVAVPYAGYADGEFVVESGVTDGKVTGDVRVKVNFKKTEDMKMLTFIANRNGYYSQGLTQYLFVAGQTKWKDIELPTLQARPGYRFAGWKIKRGEEKYVPFEIDGEEVIGTTDVTLRAIFLPIPPEA